MNSSPTGRKRIIAWTLATLVSAGVLVSFEWVNYRGVVRFNSLPVSAWDKLLIGWLLLVKTLWLLTPPLVLGIALGKFGLRRWGQTVWFLGVAGVVFWLAADVKLQQITGNHLSNYAGFLLEPWNFQWGGDMSALVRPVSIALSIIVGGLGTTLWVSRRLLRRYAFLSGARLWCGAAVVFLVVLVGVVPAHGLVTCGVAVEQLHASLPFDPYGFALKQVPPSERDQFRRDVNDALEPVMEELLTGLTQLAPPDEQDIPIRNPKPHVVLIVLESLRQEALTEPFMPKMTKWAERGLRCDRHYSGSNCSYLGIFSLMFARTPLHYWQAVDEHAVPQFAASLRRQGYECNFLTSGSVQYLRMNDFLRAPAFERVEVYNDTQDWPTDDRMVLRRGRQILQSETPQLLVMFLMSTHFPYKYPPECEKHKPVVPADLVLRTTPRQRAEVVNRYKNAANFLDRELAEFVGDLDPKKHVFALTGDHGESIFDDGTLAHYSRLSEAQTSVPMAIVGEGVPAMRITTATTHADLLPTMLHGLSGQPIKLKGSTGRDLLAGPQPDQVFICTKFASASGWEGLMIRGQERLALRFAMEPRWLQVLGLVDQSACLEATTCPAPTAAAGWAETFREEWGRLER